MIYCIEIPHQTEPRLVSYADRAAIVQAAMNEDGWYFEKASRFYYGSMPRKEDIDPEYDDPIDWDQVHEDVPHELSFVEAIEILEQDLHRMLVIETEGELADTIWHKGHQEISVRAIAKQIDPETLLP